jgi:hypothetical protein
MSAKLHRDSAHLPCGTVDTLAISVPPLSSPRPLHGVPPLDRVRASRNWKCARARARARVRARVQVCAGERGPSSLVRASPTGPPQGCLRVGRPVRVRRGTEQPPPPGLGRPHCSGAPSRGRARALCRRGCARCCVALLE